MSIWENKHTISKYCICDSRIIRIRPDKERNNLLVFTENGHVHHVDGFSFKVIKSKKISEKDISCVEEVAIRSSRGFIVADVDGNLFLYNPSFNAPKSLGTKESFVTAIEDVGRSRVLISYKTLNGIVRLEIISNLDGKVRSQMDLIEKNPIRDFHCPAHRYGFEKGYILGGTIHSLVTINYERDVLTDFTVRSVGDDCFIDEVACETIGVYYSAGEGFEDENDKRSTITMKDGARVIVEENHFCIKSLYGDLAKAGDLGEGEVTCSQLHEPLGRIVCGTPDGRLIVIDYRMNSMKFIFD